jgi:endonuclease-3 related protein
MYGKQGWWPAENLFEIIIGAILTQRTSWENVEQSLFELKKKNLLNISSLSTYPINKIAEIIKPVGFYQQKAQYLKNMITLITDKYEGNLLKLLMLPAPQLRKILLSVKGIGPETADSIILYAAGKPEFIADSYTIRILNRLGLTSQQTYTTIRKYLQRSLPNDPDILKEYHALMVKHGKVHCKSKPKCHGCPLKKNCVYQKTQKVKNMD